MSSHHHHLAAGHGGTRATRTVLLLVLGALALFGTISLEKHRDDHVLSDHGGGGGGSDGWMSNIHTPRSGTSYDSGDGVRAGGGVGMGGSSTGNSGLGQLTDNLKASLAIDRGGSTPLSWEGPRSPPPPPSAADAKAEAEADAKARAAAELHHAVAAQETEAHRQAAEELAVARAEEEAEAARADMGGAGEGEEAQEGAAGAVEGGDGDGEDGDDAAQGGGGEPTGGGATAAAGDKHHRAKDRAGRGFVAHPGAGVPHGHLHGHRAEDAAAAAHPHHHGATYGGTRAAPAEPEDITEKPMPHHKSVGHFSKGGAGRLGAASRDGRCPPMFEDGSPECMAISNKLRRAFPYMTEPFLGDLTLTQHAIKGKETVTTCLPPKWHHPISLGRVTNKMSRALPETDVPMGRIFDSCAIVGSSGILNAYDNGDEIDAHDMVFRFNSAPVKGFGKAAGKRTTHRLTNTRNFAYREFPSEHVFVHLRNKGSLDALVRQKGKNQNLRLYGINPAWHRFMDKTFGYLSTSGLNGIMIAMHKCLEVHLYGFHVSPQQGHLYHYYNPKDVPANVGRDDKEWFVVKALVEGGFVKFMEPCILECHESKRVCSKCVAEAKAAQAAVSEGDLGGEEAEGRRRRVRRRLLRS